MKYYDWLKDDISNPKVIMMNVWVKEHIVTSQLSYVAMMIGKPIRTMYDKNNEKICNIKLPDLFAKLGIDNVIAHELKIKKYD